MLRSGIDIVALAVWSVYCSIPLFWLVVHPFIERWRRHGRRAYARILPIWALFIAVALVLLWPFRQEHFYRNWFAWIPGLSLFWIGFSIYAAAFRCFERSQVSGLAELEPEEHRQVLVTRSEERRVGK